jgi:hypothetical protein
MTVTLETRQQAYDKAKKAYDDAVAANKKLPRSQRAPLPDLPEPLVIPADGIASKDVNATDVRAVDSDTGISSGWSKSEAEAKDALSSAILDAQ